MKKQYFIPPQYINLSKDGVKILELIGLQLTIPSVNDVKKQDVRISDIDFSTRATHILREILRDNPHWNTMKISEFVSQYSMQEINKYRNCGPKTIQEIKEVLYTYGFELSNKGV